MEQGGNPIKSIRAFARMMYPHMIEAGKGCWEACQDTDAIISPTFGSYFVPHINEKLKVPTVVTLLQPQHPTGAFPSYLASPWRNRIALINRLSWLAYDAMNWFPQKSWINDWRRDYLGLRKLPRTQILSGRTKDKKTLCLYGFSPLVVPKPQDWGDNVEITGYWFLDLKTNWTAPSGLSDFLAAGPAPVYIGFGSMSTRNSEKTTDIILKSFERTGQQGLLAKGWGGVSQADLPDNIFLIESAPHDWLFPRMAAVVHHCGAGTTAAGLRAGIPTIPVPHFADQPFWSKCLFDLGVAPKQILQEELSVERLTEAIKIVTSDEQMKKRAAALGEKIRSEDGVGNAVRIIDKHLKLP
jgi:UDP:flavonoid glycosyltransferase YjiC (YdhE family)